MHKKKKANLIGGGMRADVELAAAGSGVVHRAQHLLPAHQHLDLLPGGHAFATLGFLQSLADERRVVVHLRFGILVLDPATDR